MIDYKITKEDKIWDKHLRQAFTAWNRSTAYECYIREIPYNHERQEFLKKEWDIIQEEHNEYCKTPAETPRIIKPPAE